MYFFRRYMALMVAGHFVAPLLPGAAAAGGPSFGDFTFTIEVAGADSTDAATEQELRESGTSMVPARSSAASRDPLRPLEEPDSVTNETGATVSDTPPTKSVTPSKSTAQDGDATTEPNKSGIKTKPRPDTTEPVTTASAGADSDYYVRLDSGLAFTNDPDGAGRNGTNRSTDIDDTFILSAGFGMPLDTNIRGDISITYRDNMDISGVDGAGNSVNGDVDSVDTMFSLYYDFKQVHDIIGNDTITPYVGAGIGLSYLAASKLKTSGQSTENDAYAVDLSYAAMAGVAADLSDTVSVDLGYRFVNLGQFEHDGTFEDGSRSTATEYDDLFSHEVRAGIRYNF